MAKRANNEGSIYYDKGKKLWRGYVNTGFEMKGGKRVPTTKSCSGKTEEEVLQKLEKIKADNHYGNLIKADDMLLSIWCDIWLRDYCKTTLKPATYDNYWRQIEKHIKPKLGVYKLQEITQDMVQRFINEKFLNGGVKKEGGLKASSCWKIHQVLDLAMERAVMTGRILRNPCKGIKLPQDEVEEEMVIFTKEQREHIINVAREYAIDDAHYRDYLLIKTAFMTGMREGELAAVRWDNFIYNLQDAKSAEIQVRWTGGNRVYIQGEEAEKGGTKTKLTHGRTKTKSSIRDIPLAGRIGNNDIVAELIAWKHRHAEMLAKNGIKQRRDSPIFSTANNTMLSTRNIQRSWHRILEKAGIEAVNFHSARHTFASELMHLPDTDITREERAKILGHSNPNFTEKVYVKVDKSKQRKAMEALWDNNGDVQKS